MHTHTTTYTYSGTNGICLLAAVQLRNSYYKNHLSPGGFVPFKLCLRRKTVGKEWVFFSRGGSLKAQVSSFATPMWCLSGGFDLGQEVWLVPGGNSDRFDHSNLFLLCFYIWYLLLVAISSRKVVGCGASSGLFV